MRRYRMSRGGSRRSFKRGFRMHRKNTVGAPVMRGGIRL